MIHIYKDKNKTIFFNMKIIYNNIIPFKGFRAVNLFGVIFARKDAFPLTPTIMNRHKIYTAQMRELLYVGFYIVYIFEWLWRKIRQSYTGEDICRNISFGREAYAKQNKFNYLACRKHFAQWRK